MMFQLRQSKGKLENLKELVQALEENSQVHSNENHMEQMSQSSPPS